MAAAVIDDRLVEPLVVGAGVGYLAVLAWSMTNLSYEIWGALIVAPVLLVLGGFMLRGLFRGSQDELFGVMMIGMAAKLAGGIARYWVSFDAYGGATDAERYHRYGASAASAVWSGDASWTSVLPQGTGTRFMETFTGFVYTFTGTSRMGAFFVFAWIAYWGVALFVKAAAIAVPGLVRRQYALIVVLAPSVIFWPSSIGKEAYMFLTLGVGTFGIARLMSRPGIVVSIAITLAGLGAAAFVRPHIVGVWAAGLFPGLLVMLARGRSGSWRTTGRRTVDRFAAVVLLAAAVVGLFFAAKIAVANLNFNAEEVSSTSINQILTETTRRTTKSGSTFHPPVIDSALDWPYASIRTLLRPLPNEVGSLGQLLAAAELMVVVGMCLVWRRRVANLPRMIVNNPYVAFSIATLLFAGLAYSSFGNLGVLTRQKSLVFPFLLLIPCLPSRPPVAVRRHPSQNSSTSPRDSDQLASAGMPPAPIARHVSTGPPPGRGTSGPNTWAPPRRTT